ncbi:hypothetical protein FGG08_006098 [Glutinoglossum americanum]|uniref:Endoplasmic reticulum lectin n=1 Tax=Glutinoglossum americanum TaxID=1670608 RepID=A0A9P8I1Z5_9PEZI|nr:hypothetical protein FGG08_006098 [Glutinoglossum americanum]
MKLNLVLLSLAPVALGIQRVFNAYDDLLALPQFQIYISDSFIIDTDAKSRLALGASAKAEATSPRSQQPIELLGTETEADNDFDGPSKTYEPMLLNGKRYLCAIPIVSALPENDTSTKTSRAETENELSRATTRGWELLKDMEGNCLYFVSGWWSYSFCYNSEVKQFHQLPSYRGVSTWPPMEDPQTPSYILGRAKPAHRQKGKGKGNTNNQAQARPGGADTTELRVKGEMRYLVQELRGGTICDLTGRERKIEVQSVDKIEKIKEVSTCSYLMVIYTPRLCSDVTFLPPRENKAHSITCREVIPSDDIEDWKIRKTAESQRKFLVGTQEPATVGGIEVGAALNVGKDGRRIDSGDRGSVDVVATSKGRAKGGKVEMLTDEELRKLDLDPETIDMLREKLQNLAGDKGWTLEVFDTEDGEREIRGVLDPDPSEADESGPDGETSFEEDEGGKDENAEGGEGFQPEL